MPSLHPGIFPAFHSCLKIRNIRIFFAATALFICAGSYGQGNQWAWMLTIDTYGNFGTKGVPSPANRPGSRSNPFFWQDNTGTFWLFGGGGWAQSTEGSLNDLWKFNPITREWTWVAGDSIANVLGIYGTMGVAAPTNIIGGRLEGTGWSDPSGNIWIFGGSVPEPGIVMDRNDLWKFDPVTGYWTWMHGKQTRGDEGTYGTQGIPSAFNDPKARAEGSGWTDDAGNLYLFGGRSYYNGITPSILMNDLWKYSTATNQWTWLKGNRIFQPGIYGTRGVAASTNTPGSRAAASMCKGPDGSFWLMCGVGTAAQDNSGILNDLWKYNAPANEWTWVSGDSMVNQQPVYGSLGVAASSNKPGARYLCATWMDNFGNFWMYGGEGILTADPNERFRLGDLWQYKPSTGEWTWVNGDSATATAFPVYGTQGVPDINNRPGGQNIYCYWSDVSNNLWLAGVSPGGFTENEFWKYIPGNGTIPVSLTAFDGMLRDDHADLYWNVETEANLDRYEVERSSDGGHYKKIGTVAALHLKQYGFKDNDIKTAVDKLFYRLRMVDADGRYNTSKVVIIDIPYKSDITVSPNPASNHINIRLNKNISGNTEVDIIDVNGKLLLKKLYYLNGQLITLPVNNLPAGNYLLRLINNGSRYLTKVRIK